MFFYNFWALNRVSIEMLVPQSLGNIQDNWRQPHAASFRLPCLSSKAGQDHLQSSCPIWTLLSFYTGFVCKGDFPQHLKRLRLVIHKSKNNLLQLFTQSQVFIYHIYKYRYINATNTLSHSLLVWHFRNGNRQCKSDALVLPSTRVVTASYTETSCK